MNSLFLLAIGYLIVVFILGAIRHLIAFKKLYESFGNFDALHKPRFEFGILSMIAQGIAFALLYQQVVYTYMSHYEFIAIVFLILVSFIAFAELGKHKVNRVPVFLTTQIIYCILQTILVWGVFSLISQ